MHDLPHLPCAGATCRQPFSRPPKQFQADAFGYKESNTLDVVPIPRACGYFPRIIGGIRRIVFAFATPLRRQIRRGHWLGLRNDRRDCWSWSRPKYFASPSQQISAFAYHFLNAKLVTSTIVPEEWLHLGQAKWA